MVDFDDETHVDTLQYLRGLNSRRLQGAPTTTVRPFIKKINNSGKMLLHFNRHIQFPDDIVDILNDNKDKYVLMQVAPEKSVPPPIPTNVAKYPVPPEVAALNIDQ